MGEVKLVVIYPRPTDVERFEKLFLEEHIPMAIKRFADQTKIVASKAIGSFSGTQPVHRIAEIYFPSFEVLNARAASAAGRETIAHAESISTGGKPIFLVAEEEIFNRNRLLLPKKKPRSSRPSFLNGAKES